jgi:hypothetical protein
MNEHETEMTKTPQPVSLRGARRRSVRNHIIEALAKLNRFTEPHFDLELLPRTDLPDQEWNAMVRRVMLAVAAALRGAFIESAPEVSKMFEKTESPEVQVDNYRTWQRQFSAYYHWSEYEHRLLLEHLQKHPGSVIQPSYAHSCNIRAADGRIYAWDRRGRVQ